jgi:cytochrome P450
MSVSAAGPASLYRPPAPAPLSPTLSLLRAVAMQPRSLLSLVPAEAYEKMALRLGVTRRGIVLVNDPAQVRAILTDPLDVFPKNDLMVGALEPLVGESIFVSGGAAWRRQRAMVEPAFSHMGISRAFRWMAAAIDDYEAILRARAASGEAFSLDAAMSHLTADIICRTIFSQSLENETSREVFVSFAEFERSVASVDIGALLFGKPWGKVRQPARVLAACERIRAHVDALLAPHLAGAGAAAGDIAGDLIAARDLATGEPFSRKELIDQIGVFFLAGHETTASVLTWAFFILSQRPDIVARLREEVERVAGQGEITLQHVKSLAFTRDVFREALRLYPPITFIPRVAAQDVEIAGIAARRGAMVMIAPWTIHRHKALWRDADRFDPDRFGDPAQKESVANAWLPFGMGPRVCVGAAFATIESGLILARLVRAFDIEAVAPGEVRPIARLTTRPAREIRVRVRART